MKRLLPLFLTVLLLSACGEKDLPAEVSLPESSTTENSAAESVVEESQPESSAAESSAEESSESESSPESSLEETARVPVKILDGDYEAITSANFRRGVTPRVAKGTVEEPLYFSMKQNGLWGLMDENGTELLPCKGDEPVYLCSRHWVWLASVGDWAAWDAVSAELEQATGYPLCPGHGGISYQIFSTKPGEAPRYFGGGEGGQSVQELKVEDTRGDEFFPTNYTAVIEYDGDPSQLEPGGFWNFADMEGNVLCPDEEFEQVGWFSGEALAPVQKDGKWAYVDTEGNFATEFVYESCWGSDYLYNKNAGEYQPVEPCYAYALWDGAVPVMRDGKWGVLDETGAEVIPCEYEAGAPYPGGAWLKENGQWGLYLLN